MKHDPVSAKCMGGTHIEAPDRKNRPSALVRCHRSSGSQRLLLSLINLNWRLVASDNLWCHSKRSCGYSHSNYCCKTRISETVNDGRGPGITIYFVQGAVGRVSKLAVRKHRKNITADIESHSNMFTKNSTTRSNVNDEA